MRIYIYMTLVNMCMQFIKRSHIDRIFVIDMRIYCKKKKKNSHAYIK